MPESEPSSGFRGLLHFIGNTALALWIVGGMLFFFIRFTFIFYRANHAAIHKFVDQVLH